jgi:ABC-type xylose transport system substrate-binding protein
MQKGGRRIISSFDCGVTVLKDARTLVSLAGECAVMLALGKDLQEIGRYSIADLSGMKSGKGDIPFLFPQALPITKDNLKRLVVDSGYHDFESVYRGVSNPPKR